ncbi:MAG: integrase [Methanobrevibacter sp.]|jgi:hypothetical protein|nr:integrase [Candidatus Methanovirga basalitermitum]
MITEEIFQEFIEDRNLKIGTKRAYNNALQNYSKFHEMTLQELINEADTEEEEGIRAKKRKIVKRLKNYRNHKVHDGAAPTTIREYYSKIRTFYHHFGIEIPYIPPTRLRESIVRYDDIPNINHIREAIESTSNTKHRALILFMASSGTARAETINLTIQDFIEATKDYHKSTNINTILDELEKQKDAVPLFEMLRIKTNYPYYTCCSPEATQMIVKYLRTRKNLKHSDKLFNLSHAAIAQIFVRINTNLGWGKVNYDNFFHSHALRKFNATVIEDVAFANTIQGRKSDTITETYFKNNPQRIKEKYFEHLPKLTIHKTVVTNLDSSEVKKLKREFQVDLSMKDKEIEELRNSISGLRDELKDELLGELLKEKF